MRPPILLSIQVGLPETRGNADAEDPMETEWISGFFKEPVAGTVHVSHTNIVGDGQADLINHGGPDKAICVYSADHYPEWRRELARDALPFGAFGENFSIEGLSEDDVCIGDVWRIGSAVLQLSQPRQPCWKLARRWQINTLPKRVIASGRTGWYFRVLTEGQVESGLPMLLEERPCPDWTVTRANHVNYHAKDDLAGVAALGALPQLSASWREAMAERLEKAATSRSR